MPLVTQVLRCLPLPARWRRWIFSRSHGIGSIMISLICCLLCTGLVEILSRVFYAPPTGAYAVGLMVAALVLTLGVVLMPVFLVWSVWSCFLQPRKRGVQMVAVSYVGMILGFAAIYYVMEYLANTDRQLERYRNGSMGNTQPLSLSDDDVHAFRGIKGQFYSLKPGFIDLVAQRFMEERHGGIPKVTAITVIDEYPSFRSAVVFNSGQRLFIFIDCLHFSVVAITTVGFGDITPATWYAKLATDVEILSGIAVLSLAIGVILSKPK